MTNVLIVEDERLASGMFAQYIKSASERYTLVDAIKVAADAELFCLRGKVDLILMDICTAGHSSGLDAAEKIKKSFPHIKIIITTSAPEYRFIKKAKDAGVESFWYKEFSDEDLLSVMDKTIAGKSVYPKQNPDIKIGCASSYEFTPKEMETLYWLVKVGSIKVIAEKMEISVDGVSKHIKGLKDKTGCANTIELALLAHGSKLVLPEY
ncbi:MAG: response regulator transcription factor [Clostridiales bacterium]|nr:response regulator transcription factor [Clostridiales bacterium]